MSFNGKGLIFALCLFCSGISWASPQSELKKGNRAFRDGNYEKALKHYNEALVAAPHSPVIHFNAGAAAYQAGDLEHAVQEFEAAAASDDSVLRGAAHYNRGNAYFRQQKWGESVEAYKESLRANPRDEDAKYNLGLALKYRQNPSQAPRQGKPEQKKGQGSQPQGKAGAQALPRPGEMTPEDAKRLLSGVDSGQPQRPYERLRDVKIPVPDEDW